MPSRQRSNAVVLLALAALFAVGADLRLTASQSKYEPHRYQKKDVYRYYVSPANSLLAGNGFETDYRQNFIPPPLQGVFIALVKTVNPDASYGTIRRVQACVGSLAILFAFWIGFEMGGRGVALLSATFIALDPHLVNAAESLLTETHYFALLFAFLASLLLALRTGKLGWFGSSGVLLGLTSLLKTFPALLALLLPGYLILRGRDARSSWQAGVLVACFAAVVSPWIARNYVRYGEIYPISTNGGTALAMANYLELDSSKLVFWEAIQRANEWRDEEIEAQFRGKLDRDGKLLWNERDALYARHAMRYIANHPIHFARNYVTKFYNEFRYPLGPKHGPWRYEDGLRVGLMLLGFAGLIGFAISRRRKPEWVMIWIFAYYAAFTALFHITLAGRLNLPVKVLLSFFAAWFLVEALQAARRRLGSPAGRPRDSGRDADTLST